MSAAFGPQTREPFKETVRFGKERASRDQQSPDPFLVVAH